MKNKPPYAIASVDHALQLVRVLQQDGEVSVSEAAELLGVARSTAHRLLAMLVYRDFAEQGSDRRYRRGPVLHLAHFDPEQALLRDVALPHLQVLVDRTNETANLMVRAGTQARFVVTVECSQALRVGDRTGRVLPARLASGGQALLATLSPAQLADLYRGQDAGLPALHRELSLVRRRGFALNEQLTEAGVSAIAVALPGPEPTAAVSLAIPSARFRHEQLPSWASALTAAATDIQRDLSAARRWARPDSPNGR
ncbi:MAG TPA: IclR family transcriptional regulator [Streptosporangiaceae bacterium]|nr:IclR family transcriptional regulator [Streptosporangiaceae bacterium]